MDWQFFGDHPALDMLNTVMLVNGEAAEGWNSDQDVAQWLRVSGNHAGPETAPPAGLLACARQLREAVRQMVADRKAGRPVAVETLNVFLKKGGRHLELQRDADGTLRTTVHYPQDTPEGWLAPLAEAAAELLVQDFALVKHCENPECMMWFADRTKSHRRRWCSMALCGNRHKVAKFRQKAQA